MLESSVTAVFQNCFRDIQAQLGESVRAWLTQVDHAPAKEPVQYLLIVKNVSLTVGHDESPYSKHSEGTELLNVKMALCCSLIGNHMQGIWRLRCDYYLLVSIIDRAIMPFFCMVAVYVHM